MTLQVPLFGTVQRRFTISVVSCQGLRISGGKTHGFFGRELVHARAAPGKKWGPKRPEGIGNLDPPARQVINEY
jgi:hypothetical protein